MERLTDLSKRKTESQLSMTSQCDSMSSIFKAGFEKRRLSMRSKNAATTSSNAKTTTGTTTTQFQGAQKQPGKENQLSYSQEQAEKMRATMSKNVMKRKKSLNLAESIDFAKRIVRRHLSGEFLDQSSSNNLYRSEIEPLSFAPKVAEPPRIADDSKPRNIASKFPIYDDGKSNERRGMRNIFSRGNSRANTRGCVTFDEVNKNRAILKIEEPSIAQKQTHVLGSSDSNSVPETSGIEFRIEKIDPNDGGSSTTNYNHRKFRSKSSSEWLKIPLKKGDEISPFKRRMTRLKKTTLSMEGVSKTATPSTSVKWLSAGVTGEFDYVGIQKTDSKSMDDLRTFSNLTKSCPDRTKKRIQSHQYPAVVTKKISRGFGPNLEKIDGIEGDFVADEMSSLARRKSASSPRPSDSLSVKENQQCTSAISNIEKQVEEPIEKFCRPTLGRASFDLKDNFIEFVYENASDQGNHRSKPSTELVYQNLRHSSLAGHEIIPFSFGTDVLPGIKDGFSFPQKSEKNFTTPRDEESYEQDVELRKKWNSVVTELEDKLKSCPKLFNNEIPKSVLPLRQDRSYENDYTEDIFVSEKEREKYCYKVSRIFLKKRKITPEQRKLVVNFMISVHEYLLTSSSTLYQAIKIFDAILDIKEVSLKKLQLLALGASWIAIKNMETKISSASEMISLAKDMYITEGPGLLCKCERKILQTLNFNLRFPDPFYMSAYYLEQGSSLKIFTTKFSIRKIYFCASYLIEVALLDENFSSTSANFLALTTTQIAARLVLEASSVEAESWEWNDEELSRYSQKNLETFVAPLLDGVLKSAEKDSSTSGVYKKYKTIKYENISDYLVLKIKKSPDLLRPKNRIIIE